MTGIFISVATPAYLSPIWGTAAHPVNPGVDEPVNGELPQLPRETIAGWDGTVYCRRESNAALIRRWERQAMSGSPMRPFSRCVLGGAARSTLG